MGAGSIQQRKPVQIGLPWSLFLIPLFFILAGASIPYALVASHVHRRRERAFRTQMEALGRVMNWSDFLSALGEKRGTLIQEWYSFKGPVRWWWTSEDFFEVCPYPTVDWLTMRRDESFRPFAEWCRRQYTSQHGGRAFLVASEGVPKEEIHAMQSELESDSTTVRWIAVAPPESFRRIG